MLDLALIMGACLNPLCTSPAIMSSQLLSPAIQKETFFWATLFLALTSESWPTEKSANATNEDILKSCAFHPSCRCLSCQILNEVCNFRKTKRRFGEIVFWQIRSCTHKNRKTIRECVETYFYGKQVSGLITPAQTCQHEKGSLAGYWRMIAAFLATKQHKKFRHKGREICLATGRRLLLPVITYSYFPQVYQLVWETVQNCYIRGLFEH